MPGEENGPLLTAHLKELSTLYPPLMRPAQRKHTPRERDPHYSSSAAFLDDTEQLTSSLTQETPTAYLPLGRHKTCVVSELKGDLGPWEPLGECSYWGETHGHARY